MLPTFYLLDDEGQLQAVTDSTPLIRRFEREHTGGSLIPTDPALAFLNDLIEDYADEWLTKAMFHYRWACPADIAKAAAILPCWRGYSIPDATLSQAGDAFAERQIGRLRYVGSNAVTGPVIEASYRRFLIAFEDHLRNFPYLMGERPGSSDFAVFGQLTSSPSSTRRRGAGARDCPSCHCVDWDDGGPVRFGTQRHRLDFAGPRR